MATRAYYNLDSLRAAMAEFERTFEMSSEEFYKARSSEGQSYPGEALETMIPRHQQNRWAMFYEEALLISQNANDPSTVMDRAASKLVSA